MYFKKKLRVHHKHELGKVFARLALITGLANAAFWTIYPLFVDAILKSEVLVGIFFTSISVIAFGGSLLSTVILRKFSRIKVIKTAFIGCTISLLILTLAATITSLFVVEILRASFTLLMGITLSLYVRDTAKKHQIGLAEGRFYLYLNIGWLLGPLIGGYISEYISRQSVFIFSAVLYIISFIIFQHEHIRQHPLITHKKETQTVKELFSNIKEFFRIKERWKVYAIAYGLNFWWVISGIYFPLYIISKGFGDDIVGLVVAGGVVPLVLMERWIGRLADRNGLRLYIASGFLIIALLTAFLNIIPIITIVLIIMAVVNIGAAFIEPLQETYLFEVINKKDEERFYGVYNTADPLANITGPLIASGLLALWGFPGIWYGSAAILLLFVLVALRAKR